MVKADLTRDYYADLELAPGATEIEIKKQFRQLALKFHPDRNPGREVEVNARFQTIQSAHEVLTDPEQRSKYDLGRSRGVGGTFGSGFASQARPASGFARGNPWASAGSNFPPPPPRTTRSKTQPPPSAGAQRYANNFRPGMGKEGPSWSGPKASEDDAAEARRRTYEAWSKMKGTKMPPPYTADGGYANSSPPPGERRSSRQQAPKPQPPPVPKRNGYAPGNPSGDEPPATGTSYYTSRTGRAPTAKQTPPRTTPPRNPPVDPMRQFREKPGTPLEPRLSTPYASHGGERTDPFESVNLNRSNSTRAPSGRNEDIRGSYGSRARERHRSASPSRQGRKPHLSSEFNESSRVNSDSNVNPNTSPKRTYSKSTKPSNIHQPRAKSPVYDSSSSSGESEEDIMRSRKFAKGRTRRTQAQASSGGTSQPPNQGASTGESNSDPKMYADYQFPPPRPQYLRTSKRSPSAFLHQERRFSSLEQTSPYVQASSEASKKKWPNLFPSHSDLSPPKTPSGVLFNDSGMNAFEAEQFSVLDRLVKKHDDSSPVIPPEVPSATKFVSHARESSWPSSTSGGHSDPGVPVVENDSRASRGTPLPSVPSGPSGSARFYLGGLNVTRNFYSFRRPDLQFDSWADFATLMDIAESKADLVEPYSFTFQVDGQTYTAHSVPRPFPSSSTENISTTFTPTDWHGKFGGEDYFGKEAAARPSRGNSTARSGRNRSPIKPRAPPITTKEPVYPNIDPEIVGQTNTTEGTPASPAAGTTFSPEEWAQTFQPQTFAPPPHPSPGSLNKTRTNSIRRTKSGSSASKVPPKSKPAAATATVESDSSDNVLFMGSRPAQRTASNLSTPSRTPMTESSPMDIDMDSPQPQPDARNVPLEPSRPEWRSGDASAAAFAAASAAATAAFTSPPAPGPAIPPKEALNPLSKPADLAASLSDLKDTEPLYNPPAGLFSTADLASTLPFVSKASSSAPESAGFNPAKLYLPQPPRGPSPPEIALDATRPSQAAWDAYLTAMYAYMSQWETFNGKMVQHFVARREEVGAFPRGWLGTIGGREVKRYMEGVKNDEVVRTWWDEACGRHARAMEDFVWAREVFKSGVSVAGKRGEKKLYGEVL